MKFQRIQNIANEITPKRVLVVYGPRRIGKTTLVKNYLKTYKGKFFYGVGEDIILRNLLNSEDRKAILDFANDYDCIVIDEAQLIKQIGLASKMIIDEYPNKNIILTGSSSFDFASNIGEPLTGRHFVATLFPIMLPELGATKYEKLTSLPETIIYGSYPEVLATQDQESKKKILDEIVSSYLYKDILALDKVRSPQQLIDLTKLLAFQIGHEVSVHELATQLGIDTQKVKRYLDLLEKTFVIKKVGAYSTNKRKEITKKAKYYFIDLGVRNAVIKNYNDLDTRNDIGQLWENYIFMELYKKSSANNLRQNFYFWRERQGKEVDIVVEQADTLTGIEIKYNSLEAKGRANFLAKYPNAKFIVVNRDNYLELI